MNWITGLQMINEDKNDRSETAPQHSDRKEREPYACRHRDDSHGYLGSWVMQLARHLHDTIASDVFWSILRIVNTSHPWLENEKHFRILDASQSGTHIYVIDWCSHKTLGAQRTVIEVPIYCLPQMELNLNGSFEHAVGQHLPFLFVSGSSVVSSAHWDGVIVPFQAQFIRHLCLTNRL